MSGYISGDVDEWIYIDIEDQHEDSMRFIHDCEKVIGKEISILRSSKYRNVEECIRSFGWFRNVHNNFYPCTNRLKKEVRKIWESEHKDYELTYVWGFDAKEKKRAERTTEANPQAKHEFPLIERNLSKQDVHAMLEDLGIRRPKMYDMGYPNNNCIGCIRGGMGYWNKIRKDFPEVFESRSRLERRLGNSILKECYLDELDPNRGNMNIEIFPECSIMCFLAEGEKIDDTRIIG